MIRSLYTSVSGLITLEKQQANITNNIANANTIAYKMDNLVSKSFDEVMIQNRDKVLGGRNVTQKLGKISLGSAIDTVTTSFTQGSLKNTDKKTDFAIEGRGFFVIQKGNEAVYTRDGNFKVASDGFLVNTRGDRVLGINKNTGALEAIFVGNNEIVLDNDNNLFVGNTATHTLATADFEDYSALEKIGDNYYRGENPILNADVNITQGALETSNVNIANEMINMMTTMRNFETNQKMVQIIDETLAKAANEIGSVR
ncbi:flagellar hook-basal body complex protein [Caproiciproducens sp. MSJ-32]|uniref:flagellar hook-basal body complex protein n=1 Tax=Caproiciproducens sp. MSJ-32 TaxID=2841527 RepID=UPI001C10B47E|nr:flagellar hook-basal body complex protein [Caproiciproducens sp. MSJ-32]MBU5454801.1 flagellar basal body rod protein FlgG [Caproiciproducens sp. MSJ-32]